MCPLGAYRPLERSCFCPASHPSAAHVPKSELGQPKGKHLLRHFPEAFQRLGFRGVDLGIVSGGVLHVAFLDHPNTQETPGVRKESQSAAQ